jgi:ParB-like chromosome segregation protein Spo0J|tara:strand:- start:308 stop:1105 length:798 start_codon:yes stop_codon:yes gene_type:complete
MNSNATNPSQGVQIQDVYFAQVQLDRINERPEVYQLRDGLQEHHVAELVEVLKQGRELDPMTLWEEPETGEIVLVDGHHRFAAYREVGWAAPVSVHLHRCDPRTARLLAMGENGKSRLQFSNTERQNAAWALVCDGPIIPWTYSRAEIADAAGVSSGTVATMRRTRKQLEEQKSYLDRSWSKALRSSRNQQPQDFTNDQREAWIEAQTAKVDDAVGKGLGFYARYNSEAVINVIMKRCHHECRRQLYDELMGVFEPARLVGAGDY